MKPADLLATERYRLLLEQMGDELGRRYGWKSAVARELRVVPSYVTKVLEGQVATVGRDVVHRACDALGLHESFFFDESVDPSDYRTFLGKPTRATPEEQVAMPFLSDWDLVHEEAGDLLRWSRGPVDRAAAWTAARSVMRTTLVQAAHEVLFGDSEQIEAAAMQLKFAILVQVNMSLMMRANMADRQQARVAAKMVETMKVDPQGFAEFEKAHPDIAARFRDAEKYLLEWAARQPRGDDKKTPG